MRSDFKNLDGMIFGYWHVLSHIKNKDGKIVFICKCKCGVTREVLGRSLISGKSKSCGCYNIKRVTKHGKCHTDLYKLWASIKLRCNTDYERVRKNYKDRGIKVCKEWLDFETFEQWAIKNGYMKGLEIDRIDNDKGYAPGNCHFVTQKDNANNKRTNRYITYNGQTKTMKQWSEEMNIEYDFFRSRIKKGWTAKDAIETPKIRNRKGKKYYPGVRLGNAIVD